MSKNRMAVKAKMPDSVEIVSVEKSEPVKSKFFKCPFCGEKYTKINNRNDPTSSWCEKCGKCFGVDWNLWRYRHTVRF
jgi:transcription elongation factor Elf1